MTVDEMRLGVNIQKSETLCMPNQKPAVILNLIAWCEPLQTISAWAPPPENWILLVWGGVLPPVGFKSFPGDSNVQSD